MSQIISQKEKRPRWECKYTPLQIIPAVERWRAVFIDYDAEATPPVLIPLPVIGWCLAEEKATRMWNGRREIQRKNILSGVVPYKEEIKLIEELKDYELYDEFMGFAGYLEPGGKLEDLQEEAVAVREVFLLWEKRYLEEINERVSAVGSSQG